MTKEHSKRVIDRNDPFVEHATTKIWEETPSPENPYIAETVRCHGYELTQLMQKCSFINVLYLLFRGELPTQAESNLLERLMIGLINPGPRHPATRAAMHAGVGKTETAHILPIALTVLGGEHSGASEIEPAMRFFRKHKNAAPHDIALTLLETRPSSGEDDYHITPGFGKRFGDIDLVTKSVAESLLTLTAPSECLRWGASFCTILNQEGFGWLPTGLAAAVFTDLGFNPRAGAGLFQLINAPGLLAHGAELANKPVTAMPFIKDKDYTIEYEK